VPGDDLVPDLVRLGQARPRDRLVQVHQRDALPVQQGTEDPLQRRRLPRRDVARQLWDVDDLGDPGGRRDRVEGVGMIRSTPAIRRALSLNARICRRARSLTRLPSSASSFLEILHELQDLLLLIRGQGWAS
jgi:hypothetical protein